ncbi:MAG: polyamine oxidase [Cognaticolwellia sp.]|jgi:polyamine oxidase
MDRADDAIAAAGVSALSVADVLDHYIQDQGLEDREIALCRFIGETISAELDYAAPADDLDTVAARESPGFSGGDRFSVGSYAPLIADLAQGLDIHLSEPITQVNWDSQGVTVHTEAGEYTASHVIVTVSAGVLSAGHIDFQPALPAERLSALEGVGMGAPSLICLTGGEFSRQDRAQASDEAVLAGTLETLAKSMGRESVPEPDACLITRWARDPYALGSYSYPKVGTGLDDELQTLGEPLERRLLFAREHTGPYFQTVHGPLISGLREAKRLGVDPYALPGPSE